MSKGVLGHYCPIIWHIGCFSWLYSGGNEMEMKENSSPEDLVRLAFFLYVETEKLANQGLFGFDHSTIDCSIEKLKRNHKLLLIKCGDNGIDTRD